MDIRLSVERVEQAIRALQRGEMLVVSDDFDRENEGDVIVPGEFMDEAKMNFLISKAKGLVCTPMSASRIDELELRQMVVRNTDNYGTKFTVSIDSKRCTTGISALERAMTVLDLCDPTKQRDDFKRPGHIFPLLAEKQGVLERNGHTEACVDLLRLATLKEVGAICEILGDDGKMLRGEELIHFAKRSGLVYLSIEDIVAYRLLKEFAFRRNTSFRFTQGQLETFYASKQGDFFAYTGFEPAAEGALKGATVFFDDVRNFRTYEGRPKVLVVLVDFEREDFDLEDVLTLRTGSPNVTRKGLFMASLAFHLLRERGAQEVPVETGGFLGDCLKCFLECGKINGADQKEPLKDENLGKIGK